MSMTSEQTLREILDRVTRLESRLVQLGDYVGANLRSKQKIEIVDDHVEIDALDVSVSRILAEIRQRRPGMRGAVSVFHQSRRVMSLWVH